MPASRVPTALPLLLLALASGCAGSKPAARPDAAPSAGAVCEPGPGTVVASFGDGSRVTLGQLDATLEKELAELDAQKRRARRQGLDALVFERLVESEAKRRGETPDALVKAEVLDKVPAPPEAEVQAFFEGVKERLEPGTTLESVRERIVAHLQQGGREERLKAFREELLQKGRVQVTLPRAGREPVRQQVTGTGPATGPADAPVTIVEFSDFQCPYCARGRKTLDEVKQAYGDKVRIVFRHFPLEMHPEAPKAAEASACAHDQGKFWAYHDALFDDPRALAVDDLKATAQRLGLDTQAFDACLDGGTKAQVVQADMEEGRKLGVTGTPAFFVNGVLLEGAQPLEAFRDVIDAELEAGQP